jgi:hypothetical protein
MEESAQDIRPTDPRASDRFHRGRAIRWMQTDSSMRSRAVVVLGVRIEDALQVTPANDEDVVETLSSSASDPALRGRVRFRRTDRCPHNLEAFGPEDLIEPQNFESRSRSRICLSSRRSAIDRFRACWVTHTESGRLVTPAMWTRRVATSRKNRTYSVFSNAVSTVKKSHASTPLPCVRRNSLHVGLVRRGAGPRPARRRIRRTVLAPARIQLAELALDPDATPPGILPAETRDEIDRLSIKRRPTGPRRRQVHLRLTSSRCHRRSVRGVTMNEAHRSRDSARLAAARSARSRSFSSGRRTVRREHPHLVAEGGVLELELRDAPSVGEHSEQANEHEVGEGSQGARMLPATLMRAEPSIGAPQVQRRSDGNWRTVGKDRTSANGSYRERLPDREGKYRSVVSRRRLANHICHGDVSRRRTHNHPTVTDGGGGDDGGGGNCDPSYPTVCIPRPPPDLDCGDISATNFA